MSEPASVDRLIRMANQIADFFAGQPGADAAKGIEEHLRAFWTPKMRREIIAHVDRGGAGLAPLSREAVRRMASQG